MYQNYFRSIGRTMSLFILLFIIAGCETNPLDLSYSWKTFHEDKYKLEALPEITDGDMFYLDKYIEANTLFPELIIYNRTIHLLEGIKYRTLFDRSKIYIEGQRKKLRTASDSIHIEYKGIETDYRRTIFQNVY